VSNPDNKALVKELISMKKRMDRLYSESFISAVEESKPQGEPATWQPLVDVVETDEAWMAIADLPGVMDKDLEVKVEQSQLIIRGTRHGLPEPCPGQDVIHNERPFGKFCRELPLPEALLGAEVKAELSRGVLTVVMLKKAASSRKITVRPE
jgi:HSP20 family protein